MLGLSTGSLYTYGLDRVFGLAKEAGFDGIEVLVDRRWDTRQADYLRHLMDRHGLPVVSLHSPFHLIQVPGWEQDPLWRLKRTKAHVHLSNYNGREHRLLQDGHLPLAEFLRRLNQNGYKGIVTLESPPEALGDGDLGRVSANLWVMVDFYRRHFAREGG